MENNIQFPVSINYNEENDNVEAIKTDIVNQLQAIDTFGENCLNSKS